MDKIKKHHKIYRKLERKLRKSKTDLEKLGDYHTLRAAGLFQNITDAVSWRYSLSPGDQKQLNEHSDSKIVKIQIVRQPLAWLSKKASDILSNYTVDEMIKRLGYDRMWHLFMYIFLEDGSVFISERNETVRLYQTKPVYINGSETMEITDCNGLSLGEFFKNGVDSRTPDLFWRYDPSSTNCQDYVMTLLDANKLSTPEIKTFVLQDAQALLSKAGFGKKVFTTLSNTVARVRMFIGKGLKL